MKMDGQLCMSKSMTLSAWCKERCFKHTLKFFESVLVISEDTLLLTLYEKGQAVLLYKVLQYETLSFLKCLSYVKAPCIVPIICSKKMPEIILHS